MDYAVLSKIIIVVFALLFLLNVFFAIKILYEINKFNKIKRIIDDLIYWKSYFFLKKFIELKNLSTKLEKYRSRFTKLFNNYQSLISESTLVWVNEFIDHLEAKKSSYFRLVESEKTTQYHRKFTEISKQNTQFSNRLKNALKIENYCLDQIYKFDIIHDLILDEINKTHLKTNFDFTELIRFWNDIHDHVKQFETNIYEVSDTKMQSDLNYFLTIYQKNIRMIIDYLKIVILYKNRLPQLKTTIIKLIQQKVSATVATPFITTIEKMYQTESALISQQIKRFNDPDLNSQVINLYRNFNYKKVQLEKFYQMQTLLKKCFAQLSKTASQMQSWHTNLKQGIDNLKHETRFVFYNSQRIEAFYNSYQNFQQLLQSWKTHYLNNQTDLFLSSQVIKARELLQKAQKYLQQNLEISKLLAIEKQRIENILLTIININNFLLKSNFSHLNELYSPELKAIGKQFTQLTEQATGQTSLPTSKLVQFNDLEIRIIKLKDQIEHKYLLSKIAELLFVKANKLRFTNNRITNQVLNAEMLYLKNNYVKAIEQLIEVYETS